ncbi:Polyketide synthase [Frankliniella fusca]|uniref:Polyketide synthase n=1 Tax=Frankliniella fusca TaxID=407009 RepID=A0AAE1LKM1_9NEOP|nr:Polyketide synthase [Frankliniella fusca]
MKEGCAYIELLFHQVPGCLWRLVDHYNCVVENGQCNSGEVTKLSMNSSHFLYDSGSWGSNSGASFNQTMQ